MKNNGFCEFFFFLHGEKTFKPTKTSHFFFSFIGKDLDKEATCHRNLFPSLCVCVCECECAAEPRQSNTALQRAEHVVIIGCTVGKHKHVPAHTCAYTHTRTHTYSTLDGILYLDTFVSAF